MKITVLIDNNANEGLKAEWGLSLLIKHKGAVYLADTGATDAFAENAAALGIDLSTVDACVLSHAHFDHAGGLRSFFARNRRASSTMSFPWGLSTSASSGGFSSSIATDSFETKA